jgi:hypothetical protein
MERPFTKSTNDRGNDVYKGITRNASAPQSYKYTTVIELTKSESEAKRLHDQLVSQKQNEGFTLRSDWVAQYTAQFPFYKDVWMGQYGSQNFQVMYVYEYSPANSWALITQSM